MKKTIVSCKGNKIQVIDFTPEEEIAHLAEAEARKAEEKALVETELKRRLIREAVELREMKLNPELFTAPEIAEKEWVTTKLIEQLSAQKEATKDAPS